MPRWPKVGAQETTTNGHVAAVRASMDVGKLFNLWSDLVAREPHRGGLIRTVERQLIRAELYWVMGGNIATRANIQLDGVPSHISPLRYTGVRKWDRARQDGSDRQNAVWNTSRADAEIDTIRDLKAWAGRQNRETLARTNKVLLQLVGTSGPCEACKRRMAITANEIVNDWSRRTGLPKSQLPEVEVWSYYGNPPKAFKHGQYEDVYNGWLDDTTPPDLTFRNYQGETQYVREHLMGSVNPKPKAPDDEEDTGTTTEKPDKSTKESDTSTTKSSTSGDLVATDR